MQNQQNPTTADRFLRMPEVIRVTGISRAQIYLLISKQEFPCQVKLTSAGKAAGWLSSEVQTWLNDRVKASRDKCISRIEV